MCHSGIIQKYELGKPQSIGNTGSAMEYVTKDLKDKMFLSYEVHGVSSAHMRSCTQGLKPDTETSVFLSPPLALSLTHILRTIYTVNPPHLKYFAYTRFMNQGIC